MSPFIRTVLGPLSVGTLVIMAIAFAGVAAAQVDPACSSGGHQHEAAPVIEASDTAAVDGANPFTGTDVSESGAILLACGDSGACGPHSIG